MKRIFKTIILLLNLSINYIVLSTTILSGEWQSFIVKKTEYIYQTNERYLFNQNNTWSIIQQNGEIIQQGFYKVENNELFLQMAIAAAQNEMSAIKCIFLNNFSFEIPNPFETESRLILIKKDMIQNLSKDILAGTWIIKQKLLDSGKSKTANFKLNFHSDGTYTVTLKDKILTELWGKGTYTIDDNKLTLHNDFKENSFWNNPTFFFLNGQLRYNNSLFCLWCESENGDTK